jgi:hypothetical protein
MFNKMLPSYGYMTHMLELLLQSHVLYIVVVPGETTTIV